ncbi:hypothetical protein ES703_21771 [subsurface metagenome]
MVKIECLVCGKVIKIPPYIDMERYDGQVPCQECGSLLHIKLAGSKVQGYKVVEKSSRKLEELLEELRGHGKES